MRPFFTYYGGKWRNAPRFYPEPEHETVVEPFAGSAGYSVRHFDRQVVLCDKDPVIAGIWKYLISVTPEEILSIPDVLPDQSVDDLDVCQEAKWLVGYWLNKGVALQCRIPSAWMRTGQYPGSFWGDRVRQTIATQVPLIRHWRVYEGSYEDCPVRGPATWFVDPPYGDGGHVYRCGSEAIDYDQLAIWCKERRGQVIVCERDGASWLPFRHLGDIKTTRAGVRCVEAAWIGGAP